MGEWSAVWRILVILGAAVGAHFGVRWVRAASERMLAPARATGEAARAEVAQRHPKVATVTSLAASAITFVLYFVALGLVLAQLGVSLTAYLATASVLGLAIGFGSQGLVQDVVIGLTLLFSDTYDVGDTVEISGQIGRVESVGLRFTILVNFHGQRVFVPNRSINVVARFRRGVIRAYVDVEVPEGADEAELAAEVLRIAQGMRSQHRAVLVSDPEVSEVMSSGTGGWRFLRVKLRLWPGQGALVETVLRQRMLAALRHVDPAFPDWKVSVTYRAE